MEAHLGGVTQSQAVDPNALFFTRVLRILGTGAMKKELQSYLLFFVWKCLKLSGNPDTKNKRSKLSTANFQKLIIYMRGNMKFIKL